MGFPLGRRCRYVQLADRGLTVFDLPPARVARDLAQWQPICQWLDQ